MNNLESTIYNLVRKNPALKQFVRNMYQDIFDLLPKRWNISSLPINTGKVASWNFKMSHLFYDETKLLMNHQMKSSYE